MQIQLVAERNPHLSNLQQVLYNRGISPKDFERIINPSKNELHNPLLLDNIVEGAKMLIKHVSQKDKIFIQVD